MKRLLAIAILFSGIIAAKDNSKIKDHTKAAIPAAVQNDPCQIYYKAQQNAGIWKNLLQDAHYKELIAAFQKESQAHGFQKALKSPAQQAMQTYREHYIDSERAKLFKEHKGLEAQFTACKKNNQELIALNKQFNAKHKDTTFKQWQQDRPARNKFLAEHGYTFYPRFGYIKNK